MQTPYLVSTGSYSWNSLQRVFGKAIHQSFIFPTIGPSAVKHGSYNHIAGLQGGGLDRTKNLLTFHRKGREWWNINEV